MPLEDEMKNEIKKLEHELSVIDGELERLHKKVIHLLMIRKKKDHDLRVLKGNYFDEERDFQTTLARLLRERV